MARREWRVASLRASGGGFSAQGAKFRHCLATVTTITELSLLGLSGRFSVSQKALRYLLIFRPLPPQHATGLKGLAFVIRVIIEMPEYPSSFKH